MKKHLRKLQLTGQRVRVCNFKPIVRAKALPAETAKSLGIENLAGENRLEVRNEGDDFQMYLAGAVGGSWWDDSGITEKEVREALATIPKGKKIHVHINSEGGSVQEGLGIYNAFKERAADITCHIDGYACSIASIIPLAAGKVVSPQSAIWMIHCASCYCGGNADDMQQAVTMLREHDEMLAEILSKETGQTLDKIKADMKAETWIRGSQAVEYGLADETGEEDVTDRLATLPKAWLDRCKNIPANIYNALALPNGAGANNSAAHSQGGQPPKPQTKDNTMNKDKIVALLKKHGITAGADWSDEQLEAALNQLAKSNDVSAKLEAIEAKQEIAARQRITDKIENFVGSKLTKDSVSIYVEAALKDEKGTLEIIAKLPDLNAGGASAGADITIRDGQTAPTGLFGRPSPKLINMAEQNQGDRVKIHAALKKDYNLFLQDALKHDAVKNENTFTSTFTTNFLILEATTQASPKFASIPMFARDTKVDPMKPLASGVYQFNTTAQDGSTAQTNATNFESGDSTMTPVTVSVAQYTESFHVTNGQLNSGLRMENLVKAKLASLGSKVSKVLAANITAANFATLTPLIRSFGAFNSTDTQTILAAIQKANLKNIMLNGGYFYKLTNVPSLFQPQPVIPGASFKNGYGFDYVALHTEWSAAGANINGFAGDETALATITGLPLIDAPAIPGGILAQATGTIPGVDLPLAAYAWFNTATRTYWASFDTMFGANALDTSVGMVIATGTPS
jgi:ATP-dependent Clp protease, protease subunit